MRDELPNAPLRASRRYKVAAVALLFVGLLSVGGWLVGRELATQDPPPTVTKPAVGGARLFDQVLSAVASTYVDSLDNAAIYDKAVTGLLRELNDPYTAFLGESRLRRLNEQISGTYAGVGVRVDVRDGWPVVIEPIAGGPSARAGMLVGDRIVQVDKESTNGWTFEEVSRALRGAAGSRVALVVAREGQRIPYTLQREAVRLLAVPRVTMMPGAIGYADVKIFSAQTATELQVAVDSLVRMGARALIIDLRGNPGGLLEQGVAVAELFLDPGQSVVQLRSRPGSAVQTFTDPDAQRWPTLPIAVLVDHGSASSSEIVAGALQDHDRAVVLGTTSFGKGSAQNLYPLVSGGALRLTTARWFTPVGRSISRPTSEPLDDDADADSATRADTLRPRFRTDAGRTVLGGGGITPDVVAGDSATPLPVQVLARAMGRNLAAYRDAIAKLATAQKRSMRDAGAPVTRVLLDALYADLVTRKVAPDRTIFDAAAPWISRALGYEMARVAFGSDAEFLRRSQDDAALQRALTLLQATRTPRDVFAGLETKSVDVPISPTSK